MKHRKIYLLLFLIQPGLALPLRSIAQTHSPYDSPKKTLNMLLAKEFAWHHYDSVNFSSDSLVAWAEAKGTQEELATFFGSQQLQQYGRHL